MYSSLQNNTWERLCPILPPNTLYPIFWGELCLYGPILSCFISLVLYLVKCNSFSHVLSISFFADLGHYWKLPIFTTHIQNLYSHSDINEKPDNQSFKQCNIKMKFSLHIIFMWFWSWTSVCIKKSVVWAGLFQSFRWGLRLSFVILLYLFFYIYYFQVVKCALNN